MATYAGKHGGDIYVREGDDLSELVSASGTVFIPHGLAMHMPLFQIRLSKAVEFIRNAAVSL